MSDSKMVGVPRHLPPQLVNDVFMGWSGRSETLWLDLMDAIEASGLAVPAEDVRAVDEPMFQVRSHGSCCWEDISGESLEICRSQPEEYEVRTLYSHTQPNPIPQTPLHPPVSTWPTWANWCSLNSDGYWYYYEVEPVLMQAGRIAKNAATAVERSNLFEPSNAWASMIYERKA